MVTFLVVCQQKSATSLNWFLSFELLLFGRQVRGPLDMLKESWMAGEAMTQTTVSYILQMRDKLEDLREMAKRHMEERQC